MFEDDGHLQGNPEATLALLRSLGVGVIRVAVPWAEIAPAKLPAHFQPSNPGDPNYNWAIFDRIDRAAQANGITADFTLNPPAPAWSLAGGVPRGGGRHGQWKPNASEFGAFVRAVGARYSGSYTAPGDSSPLPRIAFWAIWNEPNFGQDLGPQATKGSSVLSAPIMYRSLLDNAWSSLKATGHSRDTILIGNLAARGTRSRATKSLRDGRPGNFGATKPLQFVRALYCVDTRNRPLKGSAASAESCPTNASGSKRFRAAHPALFGATGFAVHPYPVNLPPNQLDSRDPDYARARRSAARHERARRGPARVRLAQALPDLHHRVRLHHEPAEPQQPLPEPCDGGVLDQLVGVPDVAQPTGRHVDAVPA